ncbi:hypothetical protein GBF38_009703 [Nibea albiflora]|uniref:Uncharacterized protein n=1 Tax=Nibea albiflora TaxID=240163 RepID=A0ACB7F7U8_NIBAL|nr:hypothetical protein GBF38_009703 [Nibea albiflora]
MLQYIIRYPLYRAGTEQIARWERRTVTRHHNLRGRKKKNTKKRRQFLRHDARLHLQPENLRQQTQGAVEACRQGDEIFAQNNKALPDGGAASLYRQFPDCQTSSTRLSPKRPQHNLRQRERQGTVSSIFIMGTGRCYKNKESLVLLQVRCDWHPCVSGPGGLSRTPSQSIENL